MKAIVKIPHGCVLIIPAGKLSLIEDGVLAQEEYNYKDGTYSYQDSKKSRVSVELVGEVDIKPEVQPDAEKKNEPDPLDIHS